MRVRATCAAAPLAAAAAALVLLARMAGATVYGYYYDNGEGQTVKSLDPLDQEVMQEEILHLLGLHSRPHRAHVRPPSNNLNHTVPQFMKDIYEALLNEAGDDGEIKNLTFQSLDSLQQSPFQLEERELQAINESDIIMSFVNYGHQEEFESTRRYWFDVSEVPLGGLIIATELRIYKEGRPAAAAGGDAYRISVYQLVEGSTGDTELLDSTVVTAAHEGWIKLDVSQAMQFWQAFPKHNLGLLLKVTKEEDEAAAAATAGGGKTASVTPHDLGLIGDRESHSPRESFMVAFLKDGRGGGGGDEVTLNREKRAPGGKKKKKKGRKGQSSSGGGGGGGGGRRRKTYSQLGDFGYSSFDYYGGSARRRGCQKRTLYVSFRDLGWQDWIIAPEGYASYYCHGECSFPLNTHMNATNHAIVQTLVHLMTPESVPKPCCTPTRLSSISVLYYDESSNVTLKKYKNMVVKSCGCH